ARATWATDDLPALAAREGWFELPGLEGMRLPAAEKRWRHHPEEIFHFPDGNAGIARMLVRRLIPAALSGRDMEDQVTARLNYAQLDDDKSPVRMRLSSTVVNVRHLGSPERARQVEVTYVNGGKAYRTRA